MSEVKVINQGDYLMGYDERELLQHQGRRVVAVQVSCDEVFDLYRMVFGGHNPQVKIGGEFDRIPQSAKVLSVHHDPLHRCFLFLLEHPSFDLIPEGEPVPIINQFARYEWIDTTKK